MNSFLTRGIQKRIVAAATIWGNTVLIFLYLESCEYQKIAGDGICNDEANLPDCNFDFGDCCLMAINDTMCTDCDCHSTELVHPKLSGILVHTG